MKFSEFLIKTMCGKEYTISALTHCQAITIWKDTGAKELFKSCNKVKESKETKRYWELREMISTDKATKIELTELKKLCNAIREHESFKKFKKFESFKREPKED